MNIQSLLESSIPFKVLDTEANRLAAKWQKSGLLDGLPEHEKKTVSMLLENQAKQVIVEANQTGVGGGTATFSAGFGENWAGVALPLVRRVFAEIAAKEFVSVQSMNLPSGLVFYLDFKYGTAKKDFATTDSLYGADSTLKLTDTSSGLYGTGRFGYSLNQFSASFTGASGSVAGSDLNEDSTFASGSYKKITVDVSSISGSIDTTAVRAFYISGSGVTENNMLPAFTTYNSTNGVLTFIASTVSSATPAVTLFYNKANTDNQRGDFEDRADYSVPNANSQTQIKIPSIDVVMKSESIVAKTRKLKAQWTPEFQQDLNAYQSIDAEAELTSMLSQYISMEIDLEILDMLIEGVPTTNVERWSAKSNVIWNGSTFAQATAGADGFYNTQGGWFQTLGTKLQKVSNKIHQLTLRGGANWMVVSPTVATIIESIPGYASDANGDQANFNFGMQKVGSLNSRYKVYKNPYFTENIILMGYKGTQFLECGAVFAPYIPLLQTPLVYDPETFTPRKGLMTRYAKKLIRGEFFGKVLVHGLETI